MTMLKTLSALMLSLTIANIAGATVINSADVNGLKTFKDTSTNRVWLDIDNFYAANGNNGKTGVQMMSLAQQAGFTFAKKSDVTELLNGLPLNAGQFVDYAATMGFGAPRGLIWGMYDDGTTPYGWAHAFSTSNSWSFSDDVYNPTTRINAGITGAEDLGIFAFKTAVATQVPEPTSIALFGLGIAGLIAARRRKQQA